MIEFKNIAFAVEDNKLYLTKLGNLQGLHTGIAQVQVAGGADAAHYCFHIVFIFFALLIFFFFFVCCGFQRLKIAVIFCKDNFFCAFMKNNCENIWWM